MNLFDNKEGQVGGLSQGLNKFVGFILTIAILFFIAAAIIPATQEAGDDLGDASICSSSGGFFNSSLNGCFVNSSIEGQVQNVGFDSIPLSGLFAGGGVVFILVAVFLLFSAMKGPKGN